MLHTWSEQACWGDNYISTDAFHEWVCWCSALLGRWLRSTNSAGDINTFKSTRANPSTTSAAV